MNDREKLVELISEARDKDFAICNDHAICKGCPYKNIRACHSACIADHLIANGVTVQEWISVKDRLPEINIGVLVYTPRFKNTFEVFYKGDGKWEIASYRGGEILNDEVTHWMPLPQPPKGEK